MINVWGCTEILPLIIFLNIRLNYNVWFTYQRVDPTTVLRKKLCFQRVDLISSTMPVFRGKYPVVKKTKRIQALIKPLDVSAVFFRCASTCYFPQKLLSRTFKLQICRHIDFLDFFLDPRLHSITISLTGKAW